MVSETKKNSQKRKPFNCLTIIYEDVQNAILNCKTRETEWEKEKKKQRDREEEEEKKRWFFNSFHIFFFSLLQCIFLIGWSCEWHKTRQKRNISLLPAYTNTSNWFKSFTFLYQPCLPLVILLFSFLKKEKITIILFKCSQWVINILDYLHEF